MRDFWRRWLRDRWALAAMLIFVVVGMGRLGRLTPSGNIDLAKIYISLLLLAWVTRGLLRRDAGLVTSMSRTPLTFALLVFLLLSVVSLKNSVDVGLSLVWIARLAALFLMYWLVVEGLRYQWQVRDVVSVLLVIVLVVNLICIYETISGQYFAQLLNQDVTTAGILSLSESRVGESGAAGGIKGMRAITLFADPNYMCAFLVVAFPLGCAALRNARRWSLRLLLAGLLLMTVYSILKTGSRGGLLSFAAVLFLLWWFWTRFPGKLIIALVVSLGTLGIVVLVPSALPEYREGYSLDHFRHSLRYGLWGMALRMAAANPAFGVGPGNFVAQYAGYHAFPAPFPRTYGAFGGAGRRSHPDPSGSMNCNNTYLEVLAESGLIGLVAFVSVLSVACSHLLRAAREAHSPQWRRLTESLFPGLVGYMVFMGTSSGLRDQTFWLVLALVAVASQARPGRPWVPPARRRSGESIEPTQG